MVCRMSKTQTFKMLLLVLPVMILGFTGTVQGQGVLSVPTTANKARIAISPYAQSVPGDSYTFIGISHPSLDSSRSQIGVALEVLGMTTVPNNAAGRAAIFTVNSGETHRVFIVNLAHSTINSSNSAFNNSRTHLIFTTSSAQFGNVRIVSINEAPTVPVTVGGVRKYDNLSQVNIWGVVFTESSSTGFAMEFVGDLQDSTVGRTGVDNALQPVSGKTTGVGRGLN